jgi:hypothetical protein
MLERRPGGVDEQRDVDWVDGALANTHRVGVCPKNSAQSSELRASTAYREKCETGVVTVFASGSTVCAVAAGVHSWV